MHIELGNTSSLSDEDRMLHENVIYLLDSERKPTNRYTLSDENKVAGVRSSKKQWTIKEFKEEKL